MRKDSYYQELESKGYYDNLDKRTKDYREYKEWLNSKEDYQKLKDNIEEENTVGLGDVVEKITTATGIKKVVEAVTDDCGCDERKDKFNNIKLWRRRKVNCIEEDDYKFLKGIFKNRTNVFSFELRQRVVDVHNYVFNTKHKNTKCSSCLKSHLENLKQYLEIWEN